MDIKQIGHKSMNLITSLNGGNFYFNEILWLGDGSLQQMLIFSPISPKGCS